MQPQRILIVEDDAIIARFIQHKLEELGYVVAAKARTGKDAIELAARLRPDLILMDVLLEGDIDGIEAVEEITQCLDVPVVYLTASSDERTIERLMKTEPNGFLIKPFDDRVLASALHIAVYRHKAKKELFEAKEMLRTTIESIDDMVFSLTSEGIITHNHSGNKNNIDYFNIEKIREKHLSEVFPQKVAENLSNCLSKVLESENSCISEFSLDQDNTTYWFSNRFSLRKDLNGNILGVTMVISDITRNKRMFRELKVSQEKLAEALNIAKLGNCDIIPGEGGKIYCNDLFYEILDIPRADQISDFNEDSLVELMHPEDRKRYQFMRQQAIDSHSSDYTVDFRINDKKKKDRFIHLTARINYTSTGEPERIMITIQDVTWQKINEKLRHDVELAKETAEMKQKFFARLSHEIKNPLSGMSGLLDLLEKSDLNAEQRDYIHALQTSSGSLLNLVSDVLDYSKMESGAMKVQKNNFDLRGLIKNLYIFFKARAIEKNIEFQYNVDTMIPGQIMADENKIVQLASNCLSNAFKFTSAGIVKLDVVCEGKSPGGLHLKFMIRDTGPGISAADQKKLFREFSQLDNESPGESKGTGLGLSICKQITDLLDGEIGVDSEPGKGSNFWFVLPVEFPEEIVEEQEQTIEPFEKLDMSVLLVEDMAVNQKIQKLLLENLGCTVTVASNGQQALDLYKETQINAFNIFGHLHYDIILMDHIMPVMNGVTALEYLKKSYRDLPPIALITADESFVEDDKYKKIGFDDCIIKPVNSVKLYELISKWNVLKQQKGSKEKLEVYTRADIEQKPVMNKNTLDMIIRHAEENNFNVEHLFESFIDDMERIYKQTLSAIELNDNNALSLIVLTVKGLSATIGASQIHATARLMDRHIRNEEVEKATQLLPLLAEKYSIFRSQIETEYMNKINQN